MAWNRCVFAKHKFKLKKKSRIHNKALVVGPAAEVLVATNVVVSLGKGEIKNPLLTANSLLKVSARRPVVGA